MNKRIKELAEQAGHTPLEPRTFADDLNEIFLQKFAELIVRECVSVGRTAFLNDHSTVPVFPAENIKQHFGVE